MLFLPFPLLYCTLFQSPSSSSEPPHRHSSFVPPSSLVNFAFFLNTMPILPQIQSGAILCSQGSKGTLPCSPLCFQGCSFCVGDRRPCSVCSCWARHLCCRSGRGCGRNDGIGYCPCHCAWTIDVGRGHCACGVLAGMGSATWMVSGNLRGSAIGACCCASCFCFSPSLLRLTPTRPQ